MSSESWSRSSSSRTRRSIDDRKRRDRHYDDYDRDNDDRRRHDRRRGSSERDRYRSYADDDRDNSRHTRRGKSPSRRHRQSRSSRSRSSSYESSKRRKTHRERNRSTERKSSQHSSEMSNIKILRASRSRSKSQNKSTDDHMDRKKNHFDSFRTANVDGNSIIGHIDESDFDREKIHKEMQERLQLHLAREGKVYPPPKPQASHPIFANDGSFLETFKKLQQQQQKQQHVHEHKVEPTTVAKPVVQQQYQKPMFSKRRGGKILKTGIVQKTKITDETVAEETPNDAWSLYLQEVKKYKNVSCDADSKTRPLVK